MGRHVLLEQGHVLPGGSASGETGGGLDVVGAAVGDNLAQLDLLLLGEQAGLHDHLQDQLAAGPLHRLDLLQHLVPQLVLHPAQVDHHVDLLGPVGDGLLGLKDLDHGGGVAVGKADHRAHRQLVPQVVRRLLHVAGGDTHAGAAVLHAVVADLADFLPGGGLGQQSVVRRSQNTFDVHEPSPRKSLFPVPSYPLLPSLASGESKFHLFPFVLGRAIQPAPGMSSPEHNH